MAARGEKEKRQTPTTASIPDAQLNAIERKKLVKAAEELYGSTHCKCCGLGVYRASLTLRVGRGGSRSHSSRGGHDRRTRNV